MNCPKCSDTITYIDKCKEQRWVYGCINCGYIVKYMSDKEMDQLMRIPRPYELIKYRSEYKNLEDLI